MTEPPIILGTRERFNRPLKRPAAWRGEAAVLVLIACLSQLAILSGHVLWIFEVALWRAIFGP